VIERIDRALSRVVDAMFRDRAGSLYVGFLLGLIVMSAFMVAIEHDERDDHNFRVALFVGSHETAPAPEPTES